MREKMSISYAILNKSGQVAGVTSLLYLNFIAGTAEFGSWLDKEYWGSGYNSASKRMILGFAFDELHLKRVRILSFTENERSYAAILKLGLHYEGIVRRDVLVKGKLRDRHYFSLLGEEWPSVRSNLDEQINQILPLPE